MTLVPRTPRPPARPAPLLRDAVGAVLRAERSAQHRTLADVADAARVSLPHLSEVERGRKEPSSEVLAAICTALDLTLADLLRRTASHVAETTTAPAAPRTAPRVSLSLAA
nr:helix-turn-helix transcriptional regulator [Kineococcus aurantiacus]